MTRTLILALTLLAAAPAVAEADCGVKGFADQKATYRKVWVNAPLPPADFPELTARTELNTQPKCKGDALRAYADLSALFDFRDSYKSVGRDGHAESTTDEVPYDDRAVWTLAQNEAYAAYEFASGPSLLAGKKRVVWGSGFAFNPTDLLNPVKDPTDPNNQRSGSWMAMGEVPFGENQLALVASPQTVERKGGMPEKSLHYDGEDHYLVALRYYLLLAGTDVNVISYYTNLYGDAFEKKTRWGLSASRFFGSLGLHGEALLQKGSDRYFANDSCLGNESAAQACLFRQEDPFERNRLDEKRIYPKVLLGTRYHFESDAQLVVEVLHQNDGYSQSEFQDLVGLATYVQRNTGVGRPDSVLAPNGPTMKNYLTVHYGDYKWNDDVGLFASNLWNLQQGTGFVGPGVNYAATESTRVTLRALELVRTKPGVEIPRSSYRATEEELVGFRHSVTLELKAYY